ncbi:MAG: hypothetical protein U0930_23615 [Pirellulales bacterium]
MKCGFINLYAVVVCLLISSNGITQQRADKDRRISFRGRNLTVDEYVSNSEAISAFKSSRLKQLDPRRFFSEEQHQNLWKNNIELRLDIGRPKATEMVVDKKVDVDLKTMDKVRLDRFGMGATALISNSMPTLCAEVMELVNEEAVGVGLDSEKFELFLLKLKEFVDKKWVRLRPSDFPKVVFRAELVDHFSVIRKKPEQWFLIDAYHVGEYEGDLVEADFRSLYSKVVFGQVNSADPLTFLNRALPHPQVEETFHSLSNPKKLLPNRQDPKVIVHDDRLTLQEREKSLGFKVIDSTNRKRHQIEGFSFESDVKVPRLERAIEEALDLVLDRIPSGSSLTFEELHLRIGSVANVLGRTLPDCQLVVTILDNKVGDTNYSMIKIDAQFR